MPKINIVAQRHSPVIQGDLQYYICCGGGRIYEYSDFSLLGQSTISIIIIINCGAPEQWPEMDEAVL